jgi:non-specific serine/threonine protein kinase/serine/threonine-protein kinase
MSVDAAADRWQRLNAVFDAAVALDARERPAYVARACAGDDALRAEVDRLVAAHEASATFIAESPAPALAARLLDDEARAGRRVGPYRLVREIGRGGMGAVYLAEREDDAFRKRVAVKLVKRGMDTELVLRRFRDERQILASLDHPNIARLLDGGTTDDGLPYFVMEYIEGEPIDAWAASRGLTVRERLELFVQVCGAVAYAHAHLVVHRDIKPQNVLVTAEGVPKLLDFGIARLLDADAESVTTVIGARMLTPEYASPEQVEGRRVATAGDVYSLGVVLYELLTGRLPYRFRSRTPEDVALAVRTTEPERPSAAAAEEPLRRRLRGDLDTIVLAALRKEPERRYASVERFAADVRRHLDGRPVLAHADTPWYRASKFVRRNRASVAAAALVLLALGGGVAATAWQARVARREARLAAAAQARAERRFDDVRALARAVLFDYHDAIKDLPGATPVRARLVADGLQYLDRLAREAGNDASLTRELASAYERVGDVQGGTMAANLGDTRGALASYGKAVALLAPRLRAAPDDIAARRALAGVTQKLGILLWETGDVAGALEKNRAALDLLRPVAARLPNDSAVAQQLQRGHDYVGMILLDRGDAAAALEEHRRGLAILAALPPEVRAAERVRRAFSVAYEHASADLVQLGDLAGALEQNRRALAIRQALAAEFPLNADYRRTVVVSYYNDGEILARMGRVRDALASYEKDLAIVTRLLAADPRNEQYRGDVAYARVRVGDMLARLGRPADAVASYEASRALRAADVRADPANLWKRASLIEAHAKLARALASLGRRGDALAAADSAQSLMARTDVAADNAAIRAFFADTYTDLGDAHAALGDCGAARARYEAGLAIWRDMTARGILGAVDAGKPRAAEERLRRCGAVR